MAASKPAFEEHIKEAQEHIEPREDVLSVINRVTTAQTQHSEAPRLTEVFEVSSVASHPPIGNAKRNIVICLVVCANLISVRRRRSILSLQALTFIVYFHVHDICWWFRV